jgi:hypothetical protein
MAIGLVAGLMLLGNAFPARAGSGVVTGTLIDDDTGWVAAGVPVHACGGQGCIGNAISSPDGKYSLDVPSGGGSFNVITDGGCEPGDYARGHQYGVNVTSGGTTVVNIHLTKTKGSILGRVLDSRGAPVPSVFLVVDNAETGGFGLGGASSGADGRFLVDCLAAGGVAGTGSYYITSFPPAGDPHGQQQDAGVGLSAGQPTVHDIVLADGVGSFSGRVSCANAPCPTAISILVYCEGCGSAATAVSDASGNYSAGPLQAGQKYDIHAVGPYGWDNEIIYAVPVAPKGATRVDVSLTPVGPASSGRLVGRVMQGTAGLSNCLINAFGGTAGTPGGGWIDGDLHTAADGQFDSAYRLVPGDYLVFVVCPGRPQIRANDGRAIHVAAGAATNLNYVFPQAPRQPEPRLWILHVPAKERPIE